MAKTVATQFSEEREQIIMDFLRNQGKIRVSEVIDLLGISPSTARLQLQKMHDKGMLTRTHGGAILTDQAPPGNERSFSDIVEKDKKMAIAMAAADTVHDGDFIALGSGTTTYLMSTLLHNKQDLTVATDSIPIANELLGNENITLYVCGGWIMHRNSSCRGMNAENFFKELEAEKSYCGADSISLKKGITSVDYDPRTESEVCRAGKERYILADSGKFHTGPYIDKVVALEELDHIITDSSLEEEYRKELEKMNLDLMIV